MEVTYLYLECNLQGFKSLEGLYYINNKKLREFVNAQCLADEDSVSVSGCLARGLSDGVFVKGSTVLLTVVAGLVPTS